MIMQEHHWEYLITICPLILFAIQSFSMGAFYYIMAYSGHALYTLFIVSNTFNNTFLSEIC